MGNAINHFPRTKASHDVAIDPHSFVIQQNSVLFRMGDQLNGIYLVNSGAVKLFCTTETGEEHITGFCMAGELVGLDALADGVSRTSAVALDTSNISLIPFKRLLGNSTKFDYGALILKIGKTLNRENDHIMVLSQRTADRRLAWFLVEFADGLSSRGLSPTEFSLPMTRTDIAKFLGLAVETVCRELAALCDANLVRKNRRRIEILDLAQLRKISRGDDRDISGVCQQRKAA